MIFQKVSAYSLKHDNFIIKLDLIDFNCFKNLEKLVY